MELHRSIASLGGGVDTIGAMAGAVWGAANGSSGLPKELLEQLEARGRLEKLAVALHQHVESTQSI